MLAIDKINTDAKFVAGVKFGAVVVDTCSSSEKATERLSRYLEQEASNIIGRISFEKSDPEAAKVISDLSTALNMSALALPETRDIGPSSSDDYQKSSNNDVTIDGPSYDVNFHRTWGIVTSISSALGVLFVLLCAMYFLMVFPVAVGTTVLGYSILFGLLLLYSVNFLFVLPPSVAVCWLRRIGMAVAYSTILSGMLVKVMNIWRLMAYRNTGATEMKLTSPLGLLFVSTGLVTVQIIISIIWLIMFPPRPGLYAGSWQCSAPGAADFFVPSQSVVALLYVVMLCVITIFFCALTWKSCENNKETRYIMVCCLGMAAAWISWAIGTHGARKNHESQDMNVVCANLACASLIMICLYLRKLYLYNKLKRKDKHLTARLQRSAFPGNFYGAFHSPQNGGAMWDAFSYASGGVSTAASSIRGSISSVKSSKSKATKGNGVAATRRPFEEDQMDDGTASCGSAASSVQVQGHDLYPMEVYDGGSQFQPSSLFNAANKGIYANEDSSLVR